MFHLSSRIGNSLLAALTVAGLSGCAVFGQSNVEEAVHTVIKTDENFELRDYEPSVLASTTVNANFSDAGNIAFNRLFGYISGENVAAEKIAMTSPVLSDASNKDTGEKIEMTAPVLEEKVENGWTYSFVLPANFTMETAPAPTNPDVTLQETEQKKTAVLIYSGRQRESLMQENLEKLQAWVASENLTPTSGPRFAGYNAPFTIPYFRRNEVMIDVE